jgi:Large ribosomal RNA subunit accumulation protein YceD
MTEHDLPLSRPVTLADVPPAGRDVSIITSEKERGAVARLLQLPGIAALEATLRVSHYGKDGLEVAGEIHAQLTQACVVTGEHFESDVVAPVEIRFSPHGQDPNAPLGADELVDPDAEDPPDLLVGGRIDLGAVATEFLALALDPYPKKPGASFSTYAEPGAESPFGALSSLKKRE